MPDVKKYTHVQPMHHNHHTQRKYPVAAIAAAAMVFSISAAPVPAAAQVNTVAWIGTAKQTAAQKYDSGKNILHNAWTKNDGLWYYLDSRGIAVKGEYEIKGKTYYFDKDTGAMQTGWVNTDGGDTKYFSKKTGIMRTGWMEENGTWFHFGEDGVMDTGETKINGSVYYFDEKTGEMQTGWVTTDSSRKYFSSSGKMQTGWLKLDSSWYYFGNDGTMQTGWVKTDAGWRYFDPGSGKMKTGMVILDGKKYYLDPKTGVMQTGSFLSGGKLYHADDDGNIDKYGGWITYKDNRYYTDWNGTPFTGWKKIDNEWYYFDDNGVMQTGWVTSGAGDWYLLADDGHMKDMVFEKAADSENGNSSSDNSGSLAADTGAAGIQYSISDYDLSRLAYVCQREQGSPAGAAAEASLICNRYELYCENYKGYTYKEGDGANMLNWVYGCGWWAKKSQSGTCTDEAILNAVREVVVNGNRTLPLWIDEHDMFSGDISSASNDGQTINKSDRSAYVQDKTVIHNKYGAIYTFYCFPTSTSDPFGYTEKAWSLTHQQ